jgi:hypothetical protein
MKFLIPILILFASAAFAQTPCTESAGPSVEIPTTLQNPAQFTTDCRCFGWDAATGTVNHYHFYADGINVGNPVQRAQEFCMPSKDTVYKIDVEAVGPVLGTTAGALSDSYFMEWVDADPTQICTQWSPAQCVDEHERVVLCP